MRYNRLCSQTGIVVVAGLALLASACNLLTPLIFIGEHKKTITAEFDKLPGSRVAVVVWTEPATLFDYPYARFELASYVADKLVAELGGTPAGIEVVDPRDIEDYLQRHYGHQIDPEAIGRQFDTQYVIYLEILEFQIRDPRQPQLLQGRISASVTVYDVEADPDQIRHFELTPVRSLYPEFSPVVRSATNSVLVREASYRKFAELVARKFHEYTVDL